MEADPSDELSFKWIFNSSSINPFINHNNWYSGGGGGGVGSNGMMIGTGSGHSSSASSSSQYMTEITSFTVNGTTSIARVSPSFTSSPSSSQVSSVSSSSFDKKEVGGSKSTGRSSSRIGDEDKNNNRNEPGSNGERGGGGGSNRMVHSQSSSLPSVYGSILCWAENSAGQQKDPCVYYLLPSGKLR